MTDELYGLPQLTPEPDFDSAPIEELTVEDEPAPATMVAEEAPVVAEVEVEAEPTSQAAPEPLQNGIVVR